MQAERRALREVRGGVAKGLPRMCHDQGMNLEAGSDNVKEGRQQPSHGGFRNHA